MIETKKKTKNRWLSELTEESKTLQNRWDRFWIENDKVPSACKYNLSICDNPKFIWFRNAKVATRLTFAVQKAADVKLVAVSAFNCYYSAQAYKDYFKFAFVRNPWDRFASGWLNKVVNKNAFELDPELHADLQQFDRFVAYYSKFDLDNCNLHFRSQCKLIDLNEVEFVGRLENYNKDLMQVFRILGLPLVDIPNENITINRDDYRSYYTENTKRMAEKMYRKDIQLFGYSF